MDYSILYDLDALYNANKRTRKEKTKRKATMEYEDMLLVNLENLAKAFKLENYKGPYPFKVFYIYEPKERLVQAPAYEDKIVLHAIVDNGFYNLITSDFIRDSYANQLNRGLFDGIYRLRLMMQHFYWSNDKKCTQGWVLKGDIHHFFASIPHDQLKEDLKEFCVKYNVDIRIYNLLCKYIDSSEEGLPLGYQISQLFALFYMSKFDHWIKETKHMKCYGRYSDDFFVIHEDKKVLQDLLKEIKEFLGVRGLQLNQKTVIFPLKNGIDYLGFHLYLTETGKVVVKMRQASVQRTNKKIRGWRRDYPQGKITKQQILDSWQAIDAHMSHGDTYGLRKKIANEVGAIIGEKLTPRRKITGNNTVKEKRKLKEMQKINKKYSQPMHEQLYVIVEDENGNLIRKKAIINNGNSNLGQ